MPPIQPAFRLVGYQIEREIARSRELIAQTLELLRQSVPDTFLGKRQREPDSPGPDQDK